MKTLKFKTNLKCNNCVAKVSSSLEAAPEIREWNVDLKSPSRILTVVMEEETDGAMIEKILKDAGYKAERCPE